MDRTAPKVLFILCILLRSTRAAAGAGPGIEPRELDIGRVYRASSKAISLQITGTPAETLVVSVAQPETPTGSRAAGVFARAFAQAIELGQDGRAALRVEAVAQATAYTGKARFRVTVADPRGAESSAEVGLEIVARRLLAPASVDFGRVFAGTRARAELELVLLDPERASAWLDWTGLSGDWGEILPAFLRPASRGMELAPEEPARVELELQVPQGTRAGRYSGLVRVAAGPHRAECALEVEIESPRLVVEPAALELGRAAPGGRLSSELRVRLEGALPERFELGPAGPLRKTSRPDSILEGLAVAAAGEGASAELAPGETLTVRVECEIPSGQEDGLYEGELVARAGAARARVAVSLEVPRPPGLAPFELEPRSIAIRAPRLAEAVGAVRAKSNEDGPLELRARLDSTEAGSWGLALEGGGSPHELVQILPPRGELEIALLAQSPEGAAGSRERARLVVEAGGVGREVEIALEIAPSPSTAEVAPSVARLALVAAALACALLAAGAWRSRPVRYASFSAAVHALVLAVGVRSPFLSQVARAGGAPVAALVRVIQVPDPYGATFPGALAAGGESQATIELPSPGGAEVGPALSAAGAPWPMPSHPDAPPRAEAREELELARAVRPGPAEPSAAPSEGFDVTGPEASLSLLEPGQISRARASEEEAFGALAELASPGAVTRGPAAFVEEPPTIESSPRLLAREARPEPVRRSVQVRAGPERERPDLDAPREATLAPSARMARAVSSGEMPRIGFPTPSGAASREAVPELPAPSARPPAEGPRPVGRPGFERASAPERVSVQPFVTPREGPAPPARELARAEAAPAGFAPLAAAPDSRRPPDETPPPREAERKPASETGEVGVQTVERLRGESPAGVPGRPEDAVAAPTSLPPAAPGQAELARASPAGARESLIEASRGAASTGRARALRAQVDIGVLKHAGDWAVSPRAMTALARELATRQPGFSLEPRVTPLRATESCLFDCAFVYLTGRHDPGFDASARARLRTYLERGGFLWVDDGSPPGDDTFDRAWRELAGEILPGGALRRLGASHPLLRSSYDLSRGYLGRHPPSGAWARAGEIEGLFAPDGRLVAVYTRNGYGRAIGLDPDSDLAFVPPAGLTPREAREGAVRLGVNVAVHALRSSGEHLPERDPRAEPADPAARYRYRGPANALRAAGREVWEPAAWRALEGGSPVRLSGGGESLTLDIAPSDRDWAGAERACQEGPAEGRAPPRFGLKDLTASRAVVLDAKTRLGSAGRLALRFRTSGGELYETVPLYVRAVANEENLRIPLDGADFRSSATGWKGYDAPLDRTKRYVSMAVVLYAKGIEGTVELSRLRLEGW